MMHFNFVGQPPLSHRPMHKNVKGEWPEITRILSKKENFMHFEIITWFNAFILTFLILQWYFINNLANKSESAIYNSANLDAVLVLYTFLTPFFNRKAKE